MNRIDRYIFKTFAVSLGVSVAGLLGLYIIIDMVINLDDFLNLRGFTEAAGAIGRYYFYNLPVVFLNLSPVITLLASVFTITKLQKLNEHIPIVGSGISMQRAMMPIILGSIAIAALTYADQEYFIPRYAGKLYTLKEVVKKNRQYDGRLAVMDGQRNVFVVDNYDIREKTMDGVWVFERGGVSGDRRFIFARAGRWFEIGSTPEGEPVGEWRFYKCWTLRLDEKGRPVGPYSEVGEIVFDGTKTDIKPHQIRKTSTLNLFYSTAELYRRWLGNPERKRLLVTVHSRMAFPLFNIILLMVGIPFVVRMRSESKLWGIGISVLVSAMFFAVNFVAIDLGNREALPPVLAAWLPVAIFGAGGLYLFEVMET